MNQRHAAAALLFLALATAFTWPLALNLNRAVAEPGDAYWNVWILDWDWYATFHQPLALYQANILYPAKYSLAFSENLYAVAVLLFPLRALGASPLTAYNVAYLLGIAFSGFAMYLLGWRLTRSFPAGLAAGIFFAFARMHFTHMQHVWSGWLPLLLVALLAYAERPTRRAAAVFAAIFFVNGLTNVHYFLFGAFAAGVTALLVIPSVPLVIPSGARDPGGRALRGTSPAPRPPAPRAPGSLATLGMTTAIALVLLVPFYYPYAAVAKLYGLQRTYEESYHFSATPADWLFHRGAEPENHVAPGALALVVAGAAFALAWRQWPKLLLATLWVAIGFAGSLGMHFEFHRFLFGAVPGFRALRVPARWAVIAYVGLAILIALTTKAVGKLGWVVPVAFAISLWQAPIRWYMSVPEAPEVYRWLAKGRGAVAELPLNSYDEYEYYLRSTVHHRPIVNGLMGTPVRRRLADQWALEEVPDDFLDTLSGAGVETVIVHADRLGGRSPAVRAWLQRELDRGRLFYVRDFASGAEGDWVFSLHGTRAPYPQRVARFLLGAPTCSGSLFGVLDTPLPRTYRGALTVEGWAISPYGVRSAAVWFDNRTVRYELPLRRARTGTRCWYYPDEAHARYSLAFPRRPANVRPDTDVQVDVTDARGNVWRSDNRWFRWE